MHDENSTRAEQYVYVIQMGHDGPLKIGVAISPQWRLRELQVGNPAELRIVTTFSGGFDLEQALHRKCAAHRMKGEWFHPHPDVLAIIDAEVRRPGRTSAKRANPMYRYARCSNCDALLEGFAGVVEISDTAAMCGPCEEFAAMRAEGCDPFADA